MFSYHPVYPSFPRPIFATPGDNEGPNEATSKINGKRPTRIAPTSDEKRSLVDRVFTGLHAPCVFRYQQKHLREFHQNQNFRILQEIVIQILQFLV